MAEKSQRDLPYGHFGVAAFDVEYSTWDFERNLSAQTRIKPLGKPRTVPTRAQTAQAQERTSNVKSLSQRHREQLQYLARSNPQLPPVSDILLPILRVSDAAQDAVKSHDQFKGSLLGYSRIRSQVSHRSLPIVAVASGEDCSVLRIAQVQTRRQGWDSDTHRWLEVPAIQGEETNWSAGDGPIQQIRFAQPIGRGDYFLAVRYLTKTSIFRPMHATMSEDRDGSTISPNLLCSIDAGADHASHVDVNFNPWFPQQVAVIDRDGAWKVMEFQSSKMTIVARTWAGRTQRKSSPAFATGDGWSRCAWVYSLETLAICTRRSISLLNIRSAEPVPVASIDVAKHGNAGWILDFVVVPQHLDHFLALTSTHITVYQVQRQGLRGLQVTVKARILHFKNPDDLSMCFRAWRDEQGASLVLLSDSNRMAEIYRFNFDSSNGCMLGNPCGPWALCHQNDISVLDLQVHEVADVDNNSASAADPRQSLKGPHFLLFTVLRSDSSITEELLYTFQQHDIRFHGDLPEPTWEAQTGISVPKLTRERFIVDDSATETAGVHMTKPQARRARQLPRRRHPSTRTVDLQLATDALQSAEVKPQLVEEVLEMARSSLHNTEVDNSLASHTIHSIARGELIVQDVQHISGLLDEMAFGRTQNMGTNTTSGREPESQRYFKFTAISVPRVCSLNEELSGDSLATAYDHVLANWIGALSDDVPGRVKLAKVATARHVATEVFLASRCLQLEDRPEDEEADPPPMESRASDITWNIPVRTSRSQQMMSSQDASQSIPRPGLPTPSPTATPSIITSSSHSAATAAPELWRLSKYATFSKPAPMVLPRPLQKVLSHWNIGHDPSDYDWLSTSKHINRQEADEVDAEMTEKERRAIQRRAQRHIKRQRKEAAASQAQHLASSQAPEIFSASQPVAQVQSQPPAQAGSSQSHSAGAAAVASQVIPGRFGGRPPPRKKRKSGF